MKNIVYFLLISFISLSFQGCKKKEEDKNTNTKTPPPQNNQVYYKGVDFSFQPEIEDWQTSFYDSAGNPIQLLPYFANHGVNLVRLRLWYAPQNIYNSLQSVIAFAQRVKQQSMDICLDIYYSDTWADPKHQSPPAAWDGLSLEDLKDSVYQYTKRVMMNFRKKGIIPVIVQVGNETNSGFLWDYGRVGGAYDGNWPDYAGLAGKAVTAIREVDTAGKVKVLFHYAGYTGADWFFGKLQQYDVDYDIMGISYYPIWHGKNISDLKSSLLTINSKYTKPVMIVETSYPWTLQWNDWTNNIWGESDQLIPDYPATPEGQKKYLTKIDEVSHSLQKASYGFCYWAPDWVAFKGPQATDGSTWENATFFDFENKAQPVIGVFADKGGGQF